MTATLPAPLVPAEVDLTDFAFMPLYIERLKKSRAWLACKRRPELAFYLINLWTRAFHERPCGSLEDDDDVLADAAMAGARWPKLRDDVMRGFRKCSDDRLYHPVVAEIARECWAKKMEQRARTKAATEARERKRNEEKAARDVDRDKQRDVLRDVERDVHQGTVKGRDSVRDREGTSLSKNSGASDNHPTGTQPTRAAAVAVLLRNLEKARGKASKITSVHPIVIAWADRGVTDAQLTEAYQLAVADREQARDDTAINAGFLDVFVAKILNPTNGREVHSAVTPKPWFLRWNGIEAKAKELGLEQGDEQPPYFKQRVYKAAGVTADMVRQAEADWRGAP